MPAFVDNSGGQFRCSSGSQLFAGHLTLCRSIGPEVQGEKHCSEHHFWASSPALTPVKPSKSACGDISSPRNLNHD
ncbi:hypothetical protein E5E91_05185 [Deinococcus radiodurans R1 = ATCC 13939 = DSM 20539]|uniref:Uncharacterized protein n=1 Tax=Deinococcus radiodurans (strain ATCC 13939 / DSM 20539 / JCM 16871 / CCUG 27074 / LMG 4051 / NBRC 15346 / NCIMB 9279 / VKM B-1422 / R1) TaxID=243230 RepID=Q9RVN1_DEIRA|nr:hypothetical protein DR_0996 [Deinococcus radiodurans R1 = ATCC 13939 = DSM 20539]QEM70491.1 hypothetical protein DXG80_01090 [Deinococcus radiodurans]UDL00142.1 hypothetical protein E5E91_05185 [Deinococcus radiodurans R1 = ATCC 13939 = DSM 20539]HCE64038.1 hypothetical protein [Deinococcus radiodurans]